MTYTKVKKYLLVALLVSLGARLYVSFFVPGFIITFTAIILGIALYFSDDIHPIILGCTVAVMSPGIRYLIESFTDIPSGELMTQIYPDVFFYVTYGLVFYILSRIFSESFQTRYYIILFLSDFLSNLVEMLVRTHVFEMKWHMIQGILLVALGRTALTLITIFVMIRYTSLVMKQEHEKRYQHLMMQSSRFKSEVYFLYKNMNQIESLVSLSHKIKSEVTDDHLKKLTLDLSKGVHEIKKDYLRVVKGLEEIYDSDMNLEEIELRDLFHILESNTKDFLRSKDLEVQCSFKCKANVMVKQHFYLMSIIRNLINNGIEACEKSGKVYVYAQEVNDFIEIYVRDNGKGIAGEDLDYIFNTGYSTKFDDKTGDIFRGIGLTLVKEMVEETFQGQLQVESEEGVGTSFMVTIKKSYLEG